MKNELLPVSLNGVRRVQRGFLRNRDLSTNIAKLRDEATDHVVLLVQRSVTDDIAILVNAQF